MGITLLPNNDIKYREYAPGAKGISLFGEFNNWNRDQYWAKRDQYGFWELIIPNEDGKPRIKHKTKVTEDTITLQKTSGTKLQNVYIVYIEEIKVEMKNIL